MVEKEKERPLIPAPPQRYQIKRGSFDVPLKKRKNRILIWCGLAGDKFLDHGLVKLTEAT